MKIKKYFKIFFPKSKVVKPKHHHKRKISIFWNRVIRILTIKFVAFLACIFFLLYFGVAYAQIPLNKFIAKTIPPKPITSSSTTLPKGVQQAIENLATQEIKQEQANATLPVNVSVSDDNFNKTNVGLLDELLATNPSDKAKVKIKKIDQKIASLRNLLTKYKSDKAIDEALKLIEEIGKETDIVATDPKVITDREVLGLIIEQYNRLQLVLQQLEDPLPIDVYLKI